MSQPSDFRHLGLSIPLAIEHRLWPVLAACLVDHRGRNPMDDRQCFEALLEQLKLGRKVLHIGGDVCDNWDWQTGCLGHAERREEKPATVDADKPLTAREVATVIGERATGIARFKKGEKSK